MKRLLEKRFLAQRRGGAEIFLESIDGSPDSIFNRVDLNSIREARQSRIRSFRFPFVFSQFLDSASLRLCARFCSPFQRVAQEHYLPSRPEILMELDGAIHEHGSNIVRVHLRDSGRNFFTRFGFD